MRRILIYFVLISSLHLFSAGFSEETNRFFCTQTVNRTWGAAGLECLKKFNGSFCPKLGSIYDKQEDCRDLLSGDYVHPAAVPALLGSENQFSNKKDCPLPRLTVENSWICEGGESSAPQYTDLFFDNARREEDFCDSVVFFCMGSTYFSESRYPLNRVTHLQGCLGGDMAGEIESKVLGREGSFHVGRQCIFECMKQFTGVKRLTKHRTTLGVTGGDVEGILGNLSLKAQNLNITETAAGEEPHKETNEVETRVERPQNPVEEAEVNLTELDVSNMSDAQFRAFISQINRSSRQWEEMVSNLRENNLEALNLVSKGFNETLKNPLKGRETVASSSVALKIFLILLLSLCFVFVSYLFFCGKIKT
ncbi:MAG: hypothetical protein GF334_08400 [Candidatus Altiarchaeales archaeon]|nr:hypothetical protein [Candidatus Altiarchaeales archaeon]